MHCFFSLSIQDTLGFTGALGLEAKECQRVLKLSKAKYFATLVVYLSSLLDN